MIFLQWYLAAIFAILAACTIHDRAKIARSYRNHRIQGNGRIMSAFGSFFWYASTWIL